MKESMTEKLADLLIDLDQAGVMELVVDGDTLRYRPQSAVTPELAERLRIHKAELLAALRSPVGPVRPVEPVLLEGSIEPPAPCPDCNGLLFWWNIPGDRRCMACDSPTTSIKALQHAEEIRRRHRILSPPGVAEMLADLKRTTDT